MTKHKLAEVFNDLGELTDVLQPREKETEKVRGFSFVTFATAEGAKKALDQDGSQSQRRLLRII